jgi:hypothetical protein
MIRRRPCNHLTGSKISCGTRPRSTRQRAQLTVPTGQLVYRTPTWSDLDELALVGRLSS